MQTIACALFASSEQELQRLYDDLQEVFRRDGMLISVEKTKASVYRAWITPSEWLEPQVTHPDGTVAQESLAFKCLGQLKERRGATKEVTVRLAAVHDTWRQLKGKIFRCRGIPVKLRV